VKGLKSRLERTSDRFVRQKLILKINETTNKMNMKFLSYLQGAGVYQNPRRPRDLSLLFFDQQIGMEFD
jgi:hypothetical protein